MGQWSGQDHTAGTPGARAQRPWSFQRFMFMLCLIVAGEAVFALPFHIARFFRPTLLEVLGFTNIELGAAQAVYGVLAMLAYFPGGPLADRFSARKLLAASLCATAVGGVYLATLPGFQGAVILWGFWGVTSILLFWAALIRATRDWGGTDEQGRAYGILEGGRGLLAAAMASAAVMLLSLLLPEEVASATLQEKEQSLRIVIYGYSLATLGAGVFVWFFVADGGQADRIQTRSESLRAHIGRVLRLPSVWLQTLIVVCAYVGYKGFDNYSLFAAQGYGMDDVEAARVAVLSAWVRPFAAVGAGFLGDRVRSSRVIVAGFAILLLSDLFFALTEPVPSAPWILIVNILLTCVAIFGLRGVYFAVFQEAKVPTAVTGTAVGLVSVIGYTPDVFVGLVGGWLLDRSPGVAGHQHFFLFLAGFAALGLVVSLAFARLTTHNAR